MTKQEVIKFLSLIKSTVFLGNRKFLDALDCAIELLTQPEPCEDAVSRQEAIDTVRKRSVKEVTPAYMLIDKAEVMTELALLPPVHSKTCVYWDRESNFCALHRTSAHLEHRWIPCYPSELPKDMPLWVTFDDGYGYRYVETVFWDMTEWNVDVSNAIAYMPYEEPEPYKEGDEEK